MLISIYKWRSRYVNNKIYHDNWDGEWADGLDYIINPKAEFYFGEIERYYKTLPKKRKYLRVFDMGCGDGKVGISVANLIEKYTKLNIHVLYHGVDVSKTAIESFNKKILSNEFDRVSFSTEVLDIFNIDVTYEKYDIVIMSDVLDHVDRKEKLISSVSEIIKVGGVLLYGTIEYSIRSILELSLFSELFRITPFLSHNHVLFTSPCEMGSILLDYNMDQSLKINRIQLDYINIVKNLFYQNTVNSMLYKQENGLDCTTDRSIWSLSDYFFLTSAIKIK